MNRSQLATSLILTASASLFAVQGCNTSTDLPPVPQQTDQGTGGTPAAGVTTGGTSGVTGPTGGTAAVGGGVQTGGTLGATPATGGTPAVGQPTGGTPAVGQPTGGRANVATGGSPVTVSTGGSNVAATGGTPGVITATGGAPVVVAGTGGGSTGPTGTTVTITNGKGLGAMTGWGFIARGSADPVTDPTCDSTKIVMPATGCVVSPNWNSTSSLCVTGSTPALPATPTQTDYDTNWGINVGLSATETKGGTLGQAFTSITISVTGTPTTGLRAIVSTATGDYCATLTPGTAIPFASFNKTCWTPTTAGAFSATSASSITQVQVQAYAGSAAVTVTNLCLTGITFS